MERLLGHRERPVPSLRAARGDVPEAVDELFRRMLAKSPEARPQTMDDLVAEIKRARKGPVRAAPKRPPPSGVDWRDEDDDSDSIYDVVSSEQAAPRRPADAPSTVFVRSRSPSSDRVEGPRAGRTAGRRWMIALLIVAAIAAVATFFTLRQRSSGRNG
jgi:hypothetical protein